MPGRRRREEGPCRPRRRRGMRLMLRPALLLLLAEGDSHGYDLMDQLESLGFDTECLDSSIVYRDLRDMEDMGLVKSSWDDESKGPRRRVYEVTDEGMSRLGGWLESLEHVREQIDTLQKRYQEQIGIKEKK